MPHKHTECSVLNLSCNNRIMLEKSMGVLCPGFRGVGHGNRHPVSLGIDNEKNRCLACRDRGRRAPALRQPVERFDIGRAQNPHLTFGNGIQFCLGAPLAWLEGQIAAVPLAERLPGIALAGGEPQWHDSLILRGVKSLPVRLD